jgi:hypothetical protein
VFAPLPRVHQKPSGLTRRLSPASRSAASFRIHGTRLPGGQPLDSDNDIASSRRSGLRRLERDPGMASAPMGNSRHPPSPGSDRRLVKSPDARKPATT